MLGILPSEATRSPQKSNRFPAVSNKNDTEPSVWPGGLITLTSMPFHENALSEGELDADVNRPARSASTAIFSRRAKNSLRRSYRSRTFFSFQRASTFSKYFRSPAGTAIL